MATCGASVWAARRPRRPSSRIYRARSRRSDVVLSSRDRNDHVLGAACVLDEHLLNKAVRFLHIIIVMALAQLTDVRELLNAKLTTALAERLERVFCLTSHNDIADQSKEITLTRRVG